MSTSKSKKTASGKRSAEPIHAFFDLAGRRWSLRVLWELRQGALGFRALREACGNPSPSVVSARLSTLRLANLVSNENGQYALTGGGQQLVSALEGLRGTANDLFGV